MREGDMTHDSNPPRRIRVERNIYRRASGVYEVGFKDGSGKQRWRTVQGGITAARAARDELLARRGRGERVAPNTRLRERAKISALFLGDWWRGWCWCVEDMGCG